MTPQEMLNNHNQDYCITKNYMPNPKKGETKTIDWEQRRYEIAKNCVVGLLPLCKMPKEIIEIALDYTDELIKQLKEPEK